MDEQLDKDLKNRISEVFLNFQDTTADEGWLQLRKKFPEAQSTRRAFVWIWWGSAAAILLLFLGIALWINNSPVEYKKLSYKKLKHSQSQNVALIIKPNVATNKTKPFKKETIVKTKVVNSFATNNIPKKIKNKSQIIRQPKFQAVLKIRAGELPVKNIFITKTDSIVKTEIDDAYKPLIAATVPADKTPVNEITASYKQPAKSITDMFADNPVKKDVKSDEKYKRVTLGVYAATYFNYAKGSDNQVNIGAGITSDIRLSKNLKLVTGITIAQNTLNYAGVNPPVAAENNFSLPMALLSSSVKAVPTFKNYNASLVGLDVPLNLKYEFNPQKNDTYISAGLSSGTFINELYTYKYNYPAFFTQSLQQTQGETSHNSFNSFYFAKTLNLAFGIGYPLGKSNRLIIEPFLKYPLDGLGSQNIRFGAGGLNLKLNFKSSKK